MSYCQHVQALKRVPSSDEIRHVTQKKQQCDSCEAKGPNLWLCLESSCMYVGCGEAYRDHIATHTQHSRHCLILNLTSLKIWCDGCQTEVTFSDSSPNAYEGKNYAKTPRNAAPRVTQLDESDIDDDTDDSQRPRGLTGLTNIGNTCYMNAALQALSNCQPLTQFFLQCPGYLSLAKNPSVANNYVKLMADVWHRRRSSYVTPSAIFNNIKLVHPMFRGYLQHDSQEFLRCFMDRLHEELKQPVVEMSVVNDCKADDSDDADSDRSSVVDEQMSCLVHRRVPSSTVYCDATEISDTDYETCDSGLSSENSSEAMDIVSNGIVAETRSLSNVFCNRASVSPATSSCSMEIDRKDDVCIADVDKRMTSSSTELSGNAIGDVLGNDFSSVNGDSVVKFETGAGEHGIVRVLNGSVDCEPAVCSGSSEVSASVPSSDSAISSEDGSGLSVPMDFDICSGDGSVSSSSKPDSARSTQSSLSARKSTSRAKEIRDGSADSQGRVRQANEGSAVQSTAKSKKPVQYSSIISAIFDGKILSSVQCLTCLRVSCTNETFQDLSLPIPGKDQLQFIRASSSQQVPVDADSSLLQSSAGQRGSCADSASRFRWMSSVFNLPYSVACWVLSWFWGPVITLQDCLAAFFSADELKGDNMYSCEKCKKLRNGVKYSKVLKLPEILCIHLKRFRHEFTFSSKISHYVVFPTEGLDMRPYLHKNCKDEVTVYDLVAVICHHGTAGGGHYTAYALNYINLSWYEYDDQSVTEVDVQQVENCEAYVLFYRKRSEQMERVREKAEELMQQLPQDSLMTFYISLQWISKFNTFAEPGPINNYDFLCRHGDVHPNAMKSVSDLVLAVPQNLWEYLYARFGGGPAVNRLSVCQSCLLEADRLAKRQAYEKEEFLRLRNEFQEQPSSGCAVYALSMTWFREWENFVCAKTDEPPGPIDNSKICQIRNGIPSLLVTSDYAQMSDGMWTMLKSNYGGGPEVVFRPAATPVGTRLDDVNDVTITSRSESAADK